LCHEVALPLPGGSIPPDGHGCKAKTSWSVFRRVFWEKNRTHPIFSESNRYFPAGFLMFQDQPPAWCGPSLASPSFCSNLIPLSPHIFGQDQIGFGHLANYLLDICRADYLCH
jgi:hypothetical protein